MLAPTSPCRLPYLDHICCIKLTGHSFHDHLDTLFKITHSSNFNSSVQALMLLQQLSASARLASDRFYRTLYESLLDPRLLTSSKQAMYLNVLFKALRNDLNLKRVKAFVKRIVQLTALHQPAFACAALYLVKELEEHFAGLHGLIDQPEGYYDGDEEHFRDIPDEAEGGSQTRNVTSGKDTHVAEADAQRPKYDGRKRDPQYCNADRSCLWELVRLQVHHRSFFTDTMHRYLVWRTSIRPSSFLPDVFS